MKRKVWDITVKDNPNRVVMGENDEFYTTDTEAFLVFNLQDKDFNPQSAMLTLENRNDGSLKSEEVSVVGDNITWEMPRRYIEHFGNWQGQLVYEDSKDGQPELYTSGIFTFVVNAHIGDKKKPSLVEIENWEKFIREGTELIETWEDLEALREENERQRELAESARQNEFETNETARQSTFETNETERQNEFEANEVEREGTFETNESARQANYQELLDTGVLQTNINTKLGVLEEEYAPKLTEVAAQLAHNAKYSSKSTYNYLGSGKKEKKVLVSFIIDDAPKNDLTRVLPIMQEKQIPVGIGVVTDFVGKTINNSWLNNEEFMSWEDLRLMQKNGAEIMAHSHTHANMTSLSEREREREMGLCHKILSEKGFVVDGFIYPYNSFNAETIKTAKKHYKYSFARYTSNSPKIDNNKINRHSLGSFYDGANQSVKGYDTSSLEYYKERVDIALENEEWLVFVIHTYGDNFGPTQQQYLREAIDYIRSLGIEIVSPREGFETYGNLVQLDDSLTITANGNVDVRKTHNRFVLTQDIQIPNQDVGCDFNIIDFNWAQYPNDKTIKRDTKNGLFEINDTGLYLIEYNLLLELEEDAGVTTSLSTQTFSKAGSASAFSEKSQNFVAGGGLVYRGVLKRLPISGQAIVQFNPDLYSKFNVRLALQIRNQSTTKINKVIPYQDTSHLTITKLC